MSRQGHLPGMGPCVPCQFRVHGLERCGEPTKGGNFCGEHAKMTCQRCGGPAIRQLWIGRKTKRPMTVPVCGLHSEIEP